MPNVSFSTRNNPLPLFADEEIVFQTRPHFLPTFSLIFLLWLVGGAFFYLLANFKVYKIVPQISPMILATFFIGVFLLIGLIIFLSWYKTKYILTNRRVEWRFGIIGLGAISISIGQVQNVALSQTVLGRIFNWGNLKIQSAGISPSINFSPIANPDFRKEQIENLI